MQAWIKIVDPDAVISDRLYFLGILYGQHHVLVLGRGKDGKQRWVEKPGIAIRVDGKQAKEILSKNPEIKILEIPADAEKRWRAR